MITSACTVHFLTITSQDLWPLYAKSPQKGNLFGIFLLKCFASVQLAVKYYSSMVNITETNTCTFKLLHRAQPGGVNLSTEENYLIFKAVNKYIAGSTRFKLN